MQNVISPPLTAFTHPATSPFDQSAGQTKKPSSPSCILGLPFAPITRKEAIKRAEESMRSDKSSFWVTANVDFAAKAASSQSLKKILMDADQILADGQPIVWLSRFLNAPLPERVAGSDLTPELLEKCAATGNSVFLFGSSPETLRKLRKTLPAQFPGLKIAGAQSPPEGEIQSWDNHSYTKEMKSSGARLLLVALGCPKQEKWIHRFQKESGIPLAIGIGASLDFLAGSQKRAPHWMQQSGTEWIWRLTTNPRRLAYRYAKDFAFLCGQLKNIFHDRLAARSQNGWSEYNRTLTNAKILRLDGSLEAALEHARSRLSPSDSLLIDASGIESCGPRGLGMLWELSRDCVQRGNVFHLLEPSACLRSALIRSRLKPFLPVTASWLETFEQIPAANGRSHSRHALVHAGRIPGSGEIDTERLGIDLQRLISRNLPGTSISINLLDIVIMPRNSVRRLLEFKEQALREGMDIVLENCSPEVADIIQILGCGCLLPPEKAVGNQQLRAA